jgi:hypothetical protein
MRAPAFSAGIARLHAVVCNGSVPVVLLQVQTHRPGEAPAVTAAATGALLTSPAEPAGQRTAEQGAHMQQVRPAVCMYACCCPGLAFAKVCCRAGLCALTKSCIVLLWSRFRVRLSCVAHLGRRQGGACRQATAAGVTAAQQRYAWCAINLGALLTVMPRPAVTHG